VPNGVLDLIYGRWRSQILYAGVQLGVFDHLTSDCSKEAEAIAAKLRVSAPHLYRLMRALASLGLLIESDSRGFSTSELGELFRSDHPQSLRYRVLFAERPEHYAISKHLPDIIKRGKQDGFVREFGTSAFEYARTNKHYRRAFDRAMTGHSVTQSNLVLEALRDYDFSSIRTICDVGGGHGHLICALRTWHPANRMIGIVEGLSSR
jgi:Dimerisation domain/O-methyltransferase domain